MIDLEPCPFCGSSKTVIDPNTIPTVIVCRRCGAKGPETHEKVTWTRSEDDYVRLAWNHRAVETSMNARILQLERALHRATNQSNIVPESLRHKKYPWGRLWDLLKYEAWAIENERKENE